MNGDIMEIMQIRYFLEVANSQHITQSAKKLHIAQPALSQSIKRLENELGVRLFIKKGRNVILSEYGKYLQKELLLIMDKFDNLPKELLKMANLNYKTIHINVLAASSMVTEAIIEYEKTDKNINFQLLQSEKAENPDIELTTKMFYKISRENKNTQFSIPEKIFLAVPNNEKYKNIKSLKLADVANEQFISLMGSKQFRYICDRFLNHAGVNPHIVFESDSPEAVKNMIAANLGIGFWPEFTWGKIDNDNVKLIEISEPECSRNIVITCNADRLSNKNVYDFFEFLKQYCVKKRNKKAH